MTIEITNNALNNSITFSFNSSTQTLQRVYYGELFDLNTDLIFGIFPDRGGGDGDDFYIHGIGITAVNPTTDPTVDPTQFPTTSPSASPSAAPSLSPSDSPSAAPTTDPTMDPTDDPTVDPTADPTSDPTADPTSDPSTDPTAEPTVDPTRDPTMEPSGQFRQQTRPLHTSSATKHDLVGS